MFFFLFKEKNTLVVVFHKNKGCLFQEPLKKSNQNMHFFHYLKKLSSF